MTIKTIAKQTIPLCFIPDGSLVCYKRGKIQVMKEESVVLELRFSAGLKEKFFGWSRYASRLLRLGIRAAIALDDDNVLLSQGSHFVEINLRNGQISNGWNCEGGIRPLFFTDVNDILGFDNGIYFGGYLMNMEKNAVNIYKRIGVDKWDVVYTFPKGAVNHVHNIIPDPYRNCLWVFTGDFDEAAAIWKVTDHFKKVERVAYNNQKYRGCVAFALPEGVLYSTDTPFANNYIYLFNAETYNTKELFPMKGSCIYGCKWKGRYVFSSTVEGDGRDESLWDFLFDKKLGAGIVDNYAHLIIGDFKRGFKEIYKEKKDWLSYLFQFGVFKFPAGENNGDTLFFQPMATKKNDLRLMRIEWGDN